ncbi:MAG: sulfite exporter TauE/SafE family protein, partial [Candidatus Aminicenantales bacterium]
ARRSQRRGRGFKSPTVHHHPLRPLASNGMFLLIVTAASIGFVHTVLGPDHYLPFVVIGRARRWRLSFTLAVAGLCGLGHVLSSVLIGLVGIGLGAALFRVEAIEAFRSEAAGWLLIGFGLAYGVWGLHRGFKKKPHLHVHDHANGVEHEHLHTHQEPDHSHVHPQRSDSSLTPWILFVIFVFGPCEPLIPLMMVPAARASLAGVVLVPIAFGASTILTMLALIAGASAGVRLLRLGPFEKYAHAMAGGVIFLSGIGVRIFGL